MKLFKNHKHLTFVIAGSLLLLVILEGIWLKKLYTDERNDLRESINQTLTTNMARLQVNYMQRNNVRLIDSFLSERKENEKKNVFKTVSVPFVAFYKNSQKKYLATLDTISLMQLGNEKDNATIDSFLRVVRLYYQKYTPSVSRVGTTEKDTTEWVRLFLKNQKTSYSSLWHLYYLPFSPQLNRRVMDSFFVVLREKVKDEEMDAHWQKTSNDIGIMVRNMKQEENKMPIAFVNQDKNSTQHIQIFINNDSSIKKQPSKRDSFLSIYAYDFQRYVSALIETEEIKALLEKAFASLNLTFEVSKIAAKDLVPHTGDALILTMPIGNKMGNDKSKLAVAVYGYKSYIARKILPEALFAIFVFGITAVSFGLIYNSFRQQKRLIALKNDFISNMTHELKTPITTVGVAIEAMKNFDALKNPEQTKEYLDISKNELNRLSLLVDKVLKMAAFEQKDPVLTLETLDMAVVMQEVLTSMQLLFDKFGASVDFEKKGADFTIQADKMHITSVLYNLIDNALKYGGNNPSIHVELQAPFYHFVRISIADKGQGIPPQYQDKIFDKFFRIPTGDVHNTKGHGLGLNYVANVVKQHGGKINVESEEGKGSRFSVFLPLSNKTSDVLEASDDYD